MFAKWPMVVALLGLSLGVLSAASAKQVSDHEKTQSAVPVSSSVPLLQKELKIDDFAGMAPKPVLQNQLLHLSGFVQSTPSDGKPATEATEVWIGYTKSTLYIAFICHDSHLGQLRSHLARRENILYDDRVTVLLDTFQDRRNALQFTVNPAGVEADAIWTENNGADYSFDQVWDADSRVTSGGWMTLLAIPFRSLRFSPDGRPWGVVFRRDLPSKSETDYWPRVSSNVAGTLSQEALLTGISGVTGSRNLQLNPYVMGQNVRALNSLDATHPYFSSRHAEATAGGELKAIFKDKIVVDATVNPDFSDIESDQPQFTVNQRYAVSYSELRPFFLENSNFFTTSLNLVYTRNIVHPEFGVRATGKIGRMNLGLFAADDRRPGEEVATSDPLYHEHAKNMVGRISFDLGKDSNIGAIYTDREFGGGWNRIGGLDFTARLNKKWTAWGQWVLSSTRDTASDGGAYSAGPAGYFELNRSGRTFSFDGYYKDIATNFTSDLGYIPTSNLRLTYLYANRQWYPRQGPILSIGFEGQYQFSYDHQGNRVYRYSHVDPYFKLPHNTTLAFVLGANSDTLGPQNDVNLSYNHNFAENNVEVVVRSAPIRQIYYDVEVTHGGNVNFNPPTGKAPILMNEDVINATFKLQPVNPFTVDGTYLLDRNHSIATGDFVFEAQTMRAKMNYQFTRSLSARVILEYDSTLANPLETSLQRTKQFGSQVLFSWLPHPGTAVYLGYNNDMQNVGRSLCNRLSSGGCDPDNTDLPRGSAMLNDNRQIFFKASYLFRF